MSVEALTVVLHHSKAKGTAKLVLLGIANHEGDGGSWPKVETLAKYANVDERSVQRSLARLVGSGELRIERRAGGNARTPDYRLRNLYRVSVVCPPWCDRTSNHRDTRRTSGPQVAMPVDKWGDTDVTPVEFGPSGVTPVSPQGVTPVSPLNRHRNPADDDLPASTTDRARDARPAEPVEPPDLDGLRARLRDQTAEFSHREGGQA